MVSYAKYSLVPTEEPDKVSAGGGVGMIGTPTKKPSVGGGGAKEEKSGGNLLTNIFNPTHKPPSVNKSTLPPPPNSAFDYSSAFNFKSAFEYNSQSPSQYQSAFDYGYVKDDKARGAADGAADKKGAWLSMWCCYAANW